MSRRVLVIHCHPCTEGFIPAALEQVRAGLTESNAEVRFHDLYREGFEPQLSADEHRTHVQPSLSNDLVEHAADLQWCDTLVLVYPTWWSGQPAMLKGWIDRVWASGVAWELPDGADRLVPMLRNVRRIVAVTSHGSAKHLNMLQGEGGKRVLFRSLRAMCHPLVRTHWLAFYGIDTATDAKRQAFLDGLADRIDRIAR